MSLQFPSQLKPGQCITVPVDVKQHKNFSPTVECAPIDAAVVTDDRATICRGTTESGKDMVSVHFKSELGGVFGAGVSAEYTAWQREKSWFMQPLKAFGIMSAKVTTPEAYSKYAFQVTSDAISLQLRRSSASNQAVETYSADSVDRATLAVSSAIACWGYHAEDAEIIRFAHAMNATRFTTYGVLLPTRDRIDQQKLEGVPWLDFEATKNQPDYKSVPVLGAAVAKTTFPSLPRFAEPVTIDVDVKANDLFPANMNFAPLKDNLAKPVTNDHAMLLRGAVDSLHFMQHNGHVFL